MASHDILLSRRTLAKWAAALACVAGVGAAEARPIAYPQPIRQQAAISIIDRDTGRVLQTYYHGGRMFVAGRTGARYGLRLSNRTNGRLLMVVSVDGVNVISGETANFNQRGYVLSPYETADIVGWRKNQDEIAAFRFAPLSQSYAARTGRPGDVGVIGMAVFRERVPPPPVMVEPQYDRSGRPMPSTAPNREADANGALRAPAPGAKLGTAHGEIEQSHVDTVSFERLTDRPDTVQLIEYDSMANLIAAGVIPRQPPPPRRPRPFPGNHDNDGYVPDPPPQ